MSCTSYYVRYIARDVPTLVGSGSWEGCGSQFCRGDFPVLHVQMYVLTTC